MSSLFEEAQIIQQQYHCNALCSREEIFITEDGIREALFDSLRLISQRCHFSREQDDTLFLAACRLFCQEKYDCQQNICLLVKKCCVNTGSEAVFPSLYSMITREYWSQIEKATGKTYNTTIVLALGHRIINQLLTALTIMQIA